MKLTESKLKQLVVEVINEAKLDPTFDLDSQKRRDLYDRIIADPEVHPKIKNLLQNNDGSFFEQGLELLNAMIPKYASELESYDSHQGSLAYEREFDDFYTDAKTRLVNEVRTVPEPPEGLTPEQLEKVHSLIMLGNQESLNTAQAFIDAFGGDPNYVDQFIEYNQVGDLEKLGNQAADMYEPAEYLKPRPLKPGFSKDDVSAIDAKAYGMAAAKAKKKGYETQRYDSPYGEISISPYEAMIDRYYKNRNPQGGGFIDAEDEE